MSDTADTIRMAEEADAAALLSTSTKQTWFKFIT